MLREGNQIIKLMLGIRIPEEGWEGQARRRECVLTTCSFFCCCDKNPTQPTQGRCIWAHSWGIWSIVDGVAGRRQEHDVVQSWEEERE